MANKKWSIDKAHTEIQFKVKHLMITTVTGTFKEYDATVETEDEDFSTTKISFNAKTASVSTGNSDRDGHMKSPDFFDAEKYPELKFASTKIVKNDDTNFKLLGDMTIRDITKPIQLDVELAGTVKDPWGKNKVGFIISGKINRRDFDLKWNVVTEAGSLLVGEDVKISCDVQLMEAS